MNSLLPSFSLQNVLSGLGLLAALAVSDAAMAQSVTSISKNLVSAGETITISGTGLGSVSQVLLDGQPMVKMGPVGNTISVMVPIGASSGYLRLVTNSNKMILYPQRIRVKRASSSALATEVTATIMPTMGTFNTPCATDLDGNGKTDLLVGDNQGRIGNYELASGVFPASPTMLRSNGQTLDVQDFAKPTVTDLDGNGLLDLLVGTGNGHHIVRYEQLGGKNLPTDFGPGVNLTVDGTDAITTGYDYPRPTATDLDGDGLIDLLVGDDSGRIAFYEQREATGTKAVQFELKQPALKTTAGGIIDVGNTAKPAVVDWDGNGLLDMLVGSADGKVYRYEQRAANAVDFSYVGTMQSTVGTNIDTGSYAAPTVTDLDGDGQMDLILGNDSGTLRRFEQGVAPALTPLPVVLSAFVGQAVAGGNQLAWSTAQELNSARFVVEASASGEVFAAVTAVAAAGNSTSLTTYVYLDATAGALAATRRYYRLRLEDLDGKVSYSPVVTVSRAAGAGTVREFAAYPNPFTSKLLVALPEQAEPQPATVALTTLAGRAVYTTRLALGAAAQALPELPELPAGVYLLRLTTTQGTATRKVTRE